jgi:hypothetical protein
MIKSDISPTSENNVGGQDVAIAEKLDMLLKIALT